MNKLWRWATVAPFCLLLCGCALPEKATIPAPELEVGDTWSWSSGNITLTEEVVQVRPLTWNGQQAVERMLNRTTSDGKTRSALDVVDADGRQMRLISNYGRGYDGWMLVFDFEHGCPSFYGTHSIGQPWKVDCRHSYGRINITTGQYQHGGLDWFNSTFVIVEHGEKNVGGHSVDAWRINHTLSEFTTEFWYAPAVCHVVEEHMLDARCQNGVSPDQ